MSKLNKIAIITSIVGLAVVAVVIISGTSYPHPLFSYGTAIGMLIVFLSLFLYIASWFRELFVSVKTKNIVGILLLIISAIVFIINFIRRWFC